MDSLELLQTTVKHLIGFFVIIFRLCFWVFGFLNKRSSSVIIWFLVAASKCSTDQTLFQVFFDFLLLSLSEVLGIAGNDI